jgi:hypothetical protein
MFVHAVYFWLRPDLTDEERDTFVRGARSLTTIELVRHGHLGVPAATNRPVIDRSYSYALTLIFDDAAGQDASQPHPVHRKFVEECGSLWSRVVIYDSEGI